MALAKNIRGEHTGKKTIPENGSINAAHFAAVDASSSATFVSADLLMINNELRIMELILRDSLVSFNLQMQCNSFRHEDPK